MDRKRAQARFVAYGDLIVSGIELLVLYLLEIFAELFTLQVFTGKKLLGSEFLIKIFGLPKDSQIIILRRVWVVVFILIILWGIQLWAAINLYTATDANFDNVVESLQRCSYWWAVTSTIFLFWITINLITFLTLIFNSERANPYAFSNIIHPIYVYVSLTKVGNYMAELKLRRPAVAYYSNLSLPTE